MKSSEDLPSSTVMVGGVAYSEYLGGTSSTNLLLDVSRLSPYRQRDSLITLTSGFSPWLIALSSNVFSEGRKCDGVCWCEEGRA